ncbi:hypothetical protein MMC07_006047 [Pseudocyphellaria aurata]|nr:hypothetical protein [Pseudocyphellaria aurata]
MPATISDPQTFLAMLRKMVTMFLQDGKLEAATKVQALYNAKGVKITTFFVAVVSNFEGLMGPEGVTTAETARRRMEPFQKIVQLDSQGMNALEICTSLTHQGYSENINFVKEFLEIGKNFTLRSDQI